MVFVAVREDEGAHLLAVLDQIGDIGDDDVDAEQFVFGEHQPGIDDDDVIAPADGHAVHSELAESAQRHYLKFSCRHKH